MVFFNYSTMQMAAKIVYYGPGLCGKTTNLQQIYGQTSSDSRGEMVSLETETDRTLFFDLLPIDVGTIGGFSTRIQLYTVPGQVFYNTTRKLVLKGVDGVVFVADSQKAMLQANADSLANLRENLLEMGIEIEHMPLVLQFNKRDLPSICTTDELNKAINWHGWPFFEASAIQGQGVFETLKGISKLTLVALKKKLARTPTQQVSTPVSAVPRPAAAPPPVAPPARAASSEVRPPPVAAAPPAMAPPPRQAPPPAATAEAVRPATSPGTSPGGGTKVTPGTGAGQKKSLDVLGELEKLRREVQKTQPATRAEAPPNGHRELQREIQLSVDRADFARLRRLSFHLQVEDENHRVVDAVRDFHVEIQDPKSLEKVLLKLNIAVHPKG